MALTGKKKEAADAIAAANPTWSRKHVEMCAEFLMPTSTEWCFEPGTAKREAARQAHQARMHAFLVEMNIISPDVAYKLPDDWKSPYSGASQAPSHRQTRARVPQGTNDAAPKEPRVTGEIKEPKAGSACGKAWALCDTLYEQLKRSPTASEAGEAAEAAGLSPGNVKTELSRWRKFRGYQK